MRTLALIFAALTIASSSPVRRSSLASPPNTDEVMTGFAGISTYLLKAGPRLEEIRAAAEIDLADGLNRFADHFNNLNESEELLFPLMRSAKDIADLFVQKTFSKLRSCEHSCFPRIAKEIQQRSWAGAMLLKALMRMARKDWMVMLRDKKYWPVLAMGDWSTIDKDEALEWLQQQVTLIATSSKLQGLVNSNEHHGMLDGILSIADQLGCRHEIKYMLLKDQILLENVDHLTAFVAIYTKLFPSDGSIICEINQIAYLMQQPVSMAVAINTLKHFQSIRTTDMLLQMQIVAAMWWVEQGVAMIKPYFERYLDTVQMVDWGLIYDLSVYFAYYGVFPNAAKPILSNAIRYCESGIMRDATATLIALLAKQHGNLFAFLNLSFADWFVAFDCDSRRIHNEPKGYSRHSHFSSLLCLHRTMLNSLDVEGRMQALEHAVRQSESSLHVGSRMAMRNILALFHIANPDWNVGRAFWRDFSARLLEYSIEHEQSVDCKALIQQYSRNMIKCLSPEEVRQVIRSVWDKYEQASAAMVFKMLNCLAPMETGGDVREEIICCLDRFSKTFPDSQYIPEVVQMRASLTGMLTKRRIVGTRNRPRKKHAIDG